MIFTIFTNNEIYRKKYESVLAFFIGSFSRKRLYSCFIQGGFVGLELVSTYQIPGDHKKVSAIFVGKTINIIYSLNSYFLYEEA